MDDAEEEEEEVNLNAFLKTPIVEPVTKKITKRRKTLGHTTPSDHSVRKKSFAFHSSVLAMSTQSPKIVLDMTVVSNDGKSPERLESTALSAGNTIESIVGESGENCSEYQLS